MRSTRSLIQTIGRAARNLNGCAILYADRMTDSMKAAISKTEYRRNKQIAHNTAHGITPKGVNKRIKDIIDGVYNAPASDAKTKNKTQTASQNYADLDEKSLAKVIKQLEKTMQEHARNLEFEKAAATRDELFKLRQNVFGASKS